jgi:murein L,D-transpeptidase YcbB/YkuD
LLYLERVGNVRARVYVPAALLFVLVVTASVLHIRLERADRRAAAAAIQRDLEASRPPDYVRRDKDGRRIWTLAREFYARRDNQIAWMEGRRPSRRVSAFAESLRAGAQDGLDPNLYQIEDLERRLDERGRPRRLTADEAGRWDVWLTYTYLQYAADIADGISDLAHADRAWRIGRQPFEPVPQLEEAIAGNRIAESLEDLKPRNPEYVALRKLLAEHRDRARATSPAADATDGDAARRIRQIELNLERWRWVPRDRGVRHIVVNIPAYRLDVWERDNVVLTMRVVVGKKDTPTPIFDDTMTHVIFSPYWNVPPGIARDETLPAAMSDPTFLRRTNMEVLDSAGRIVDPSSIDAEETARYRFRQRPGTGNSLGLVKFMFPNEYNVYLHDTPADSLFARATRSFSHGCVRVEQPKALAEYVLKDQTEWTPDRIARAMESGDERVVKLRTAIPVFIGYWTVDVAPDGNVQFLPDVYGVDGRQASMLADRLAHLRSASQSATNR